MKPKYVLPIRQISLTWVLLLALLGASWQASPVSSAASSDISSVQAPVLKWQNGGCYSSWCETGWYSSPAVADLDGDNKPEVIGGLYTVFILNGEDGTLQHSEDTPGSRVWPGVVVADLDDNGDLEIVTAQGSGYLNVLNHNGSVAWTRQPASNELRGLSVADLDADGTLEIIVTGAVYGKVNTWVYEHNGDLRPGWPQLNNNNGYAYGVFNDNAAVGDLDGDGAGEIVVPSDVHYIAAYEANGAHIPAHSMYNGKNWAQVGVWESLSVELRGWGTCSASDGRAERYRPNFAHTPAAIADVNGDGVREVISTGNVYDCISGYPSRYIGVYVFNADRSRFASGGYDWNAPPVDTGAPINEDYNVIESNQPNPAVADLDGDGKMEILYSAYDGRLHAFWLDKTEHGNWPYAVYTGGAYRFASEPVVADLDNDGYAEVIFGSWVQKGTHSTGKLHILDYLGNVIHEVNLPAAYGSPDWNGALAAPTLANIDADADLEVVLTTAHSGFVAYDLPGTANARVLWGTGRGNYLRNAFIDLQPGNLLDSVKVVSNGAPQPGDTLTYTFVLSNPGQTLPDVTLTDNLPAGVTYAGNLWASAGQASYDSGTLTWQGAVTNAEPVTVRFEATVSAQPPGIQVITNTASLDDGQGTVLTPQAALIVNGRTVYLPVARR